MVERSSDGDGACGPRKNANNLGSEVRPTARDGGGRWKLSGLFRRQIAVVLAGLLAAGAAATWPVGQRADVVAAGRSPIDPAPRGGPLRPVRHVEFHGLQARPTVTDPYVSIAPGSRDQTAFAAEKQLANSGTTGRRQGVVSLAGTSPQVATAAPLTPLQLAGFPVMDLSQPVPFTGTAQNLQPPDTQLAAGPANLVEADNSVLSVWTKSGTLVTTTDLKVFFGIAGGYRVSHPRILYNIDRRTVNDVTRPTVTDSNIHPIITTIPSI